MEDEELVEKVYRYLKAENLNAFFAPSPEGQRELSGKNQREIFYRIFGLDAEYVALFVSEDYVSKEVPMEEARIAIAAHGDEGKVIPIYLDDTPLPREMFDPKSTNYFRSQDPAEIARHLASKIKGEREENKIEKAFGTGTMNINGNQAQKQAFVQTMEGNIYL